MTKLKNLFSTPIKAAVTVACMLVIVALVGTAVVFIGRAAAGADAIGSDKAQMFAFADAGVDPTSAERVHTEFDYENGEFVYDIEFVAGGKEYEYRIKANDGAIISRSSELMDGQQNTGAATGNTDVQPQGSDDSNVITADEARAAALADAGLSESEVTFTKTQLDRDDGVQVYEIEFYTSDRECEYEINATTGKVISRSSETYRTQSQNPGNASYIGVDKAKEIAAGHAGISLSGATFSKAKLERDDGYMVYEIEFYSGGIEYEYTIDAVTGDIIEYDSEHH